jgi:hypothetical protein
MGEVAGANEFLGTNGQASFRFWPMTPDKAAEQEDRAELYRESADKLRQLANKVRYDFGRRQQLLALAAAFDRLAERDGRARTG